MTVLDSVRAWHLRLRNELDPARFAVARHDSPDDGRNKHVVCLSVDGPERLGQLSVWDTGEAELDLADATDGEVRSEHLSVPGERQLARAVLKLRDWVTGDPLREDRLARGVFAPFGGVVEIGAVNATRTWRLPEVSVEAFVERRQGDVTRVLDGVRSVCRFGDAGMAVADELGYLREHEVPAPSLLLWSAGLTGVPEPVEKLEDPVLVRRMCRMGADLQLTAFLDALINAAVAGGTAPRSAAGEIVDVLAAACRLAEDGGESGPRDVFRMWRVARLPGILRPGSDAPEWGKAGLRAYDEALEERLTAPRV
ncbi:hypothetical protein [Streptomyces sp. NBC_01235]|uniref:hypothetical protein n=1 Tax=Streptomyces sp. NBC_01235 TaxID=2903788 RepID=UPI002E0EEEF2|nr:hypothetical protein OG289_30505 [Streptomyces sp. NBC_01235]